MEVISAKEARLLAEQATREKEEKLKQKQEELLGRFFGTVKYIAKSTTKSDSNFGFLFYDTSAMDIDFSKEQLEYIKSLGYEIQRVTGSRNYEVSWKNKEEEE